MNTDITKAVSIQEILEIEMFKRRIKQRDMAQLLDVHETRFSEFLRGKRKMNIDFISKIYKKLEVPGDLLLTLKEH